jgi:hypothetical protein
MSPPEGVVFDSRLLGPSWTNTNSTHAATTAMSTIFGTRSVG